MKNFYYTTLIFAIVLCAVSTATAQNGDFNDAPKPTQTSRERPSLLTELDLSPAQVQQIRQINRSQQMPRRAAQQKLKAARIALDQAIYADDLNETEIQNRLKELESAQVEVARLKAANEIEIRRVLTAEQLVKFREIRRQFAERRENFPAARRDRSLNAPSRQFFKRPRRLRQND